MNYIIRKLGTCPKCGNVEIIDFEFEEVSDSVPIDRVSISCPECKHELEFENFFPIINAKLINLTLAYL